MYSADLDATSHILIARNCSGEKALFAVREGIPIVEERWLRACLTSGEMANHAHFAAPGAPPAPLAHMRMPAARGGGHFMPLEGDSFVIGTRDGFGGGQASVVGASQGAWSMDGGSTQVYRPDSTQLSRSDSTQPYIERASQQYGERSSQYGERSSQGGASSQNWDDDEAAEEFLDGVTVLLSDHFPATTQAHLRSLCRRGGAMTVTLQAIAVSAPTLSAPTLSALTRVSAPTHVAAPTHLTPPPVSAPTHLFSPTHSSAPTHASLLARLWPARALCKHLPPTGI